MKYRREIDGLRAFAVLPVIFFHAGFDLFGGGFVGVDVFFVISGYLITTIILNDLDGSRFSIVDFYERRARRILPVLFLVVLVCVPFAITILLPNDLESFSKSLIAVSLFVSNIFFWRDSGYWDVSADLKPLLHTWSLSVEEQYYLFFPVLLIFIWRFGKKYVLAAMVGVWLCSFVLAEFASVRYANAAFFVLPTRGWELLTGALVAYYLLFSANTRKINNRLLNEILGGIGFILLLYSVFVFDRSTPFPGVYATVPTVGAALIIAYARENTYVGRILSNKIFVSIGLISYSAYLWHQPLFAFARYRSFGGENERLMLTLVVCSLLLAYFSWRYVERPFRNRLFLTRTMVFRFSALAGSTFVILGLTGVFMNGLPHRYSKTQQQLLALGNGGLKTMDAYRLGSCFINYDQSYSVIIDSGCVSKARVLSDDQKKRVVIFGDSHAAHWLVGVKNVFSSSYVIEQYTGTSCRPFDFRSNTQRCRDFYNFFIGNILPTLTDKDVLIVSARWIGSYAELGGDGFTRSVSDSFRLFRSTPATVLVVGNSPEYKMAPQNLVVGLNVDAEGDVYLKSENFLDVNFVLKDLSASFGFVFLNPQNYMCKTSAPLQCLVASKGEFYYFDRGHLSVKGSVSVWNAFTEILDKSINNAGKSTEIK